MSGIVEVVSNRFAQAGFGTIEGSSDMRQGRNLKDERLMCDPSPKVRHVQSCTMFTASRSKHEYWLGVRMRKHLLVVAAAVCAALTAANASANDWVIGNVAVVEDYRGFDGRFGILVTLANKSYYSTSASSALAGCAQRYRMVVGQENLTAETQKNFFVALLAARAMGDKVRLYVNPVNSIEDGYCAVQIVSVGDV